MSKLKILYLSMERGDRVAKHFDDFRNTICKYADVTVLKQKLIGRSGVVHPVTQYEDYLSGRHQYIPQLTGQLDYDCIICDTLFLWMFEDWSSIKIPTFSIIEDQHNVMPKKQFDYAVKHNHTIIHRYQLNRFHTDLPSHIKTFWSPHSININTFYDRGLEKEFGVLLTGAMYKVYQTRHDILQELKGSPYFKHITRPKDYTKNPWPVGGEYSKVLNKSWLSVACGSTMEYPVIKFFEIPASGSVLYSDYFDELGDLGFVDGVNMITIDKSNIKLQCQELLNDKERLNKISEAGYNLIKERHTNDIRAKELLSFIESDLKK